MKCWLCLEDKLCVTTQNGNTICPECSVKEDANYEKTCIELERKRGAGDGYSNYYKGQRNSVWGKW